MRDVFGLRVDQDARTSASSASSRNAVTSLAGSGTKHIGVTAPYTPEERNEIERWLRTAGRTIIAQEALLTTTTLILVFDDLIHRFRWSVRIK